MWRKDYTGPAGQWPGTGSYEEPDQDLAPSGSESPDPGSASRLTDRPWAAKPSVLHLIWTVGPTSAQYNEHSLPVARRRDITICSYQPATEQPPPEITLFEGNGTLRGYLRVLRATLRGGRHDVIHAHAPPLGMALLLLNALRLRGTGNAVFTLHTSRKNLRFRDRLMMYPIVMLFRRVVFVGTTALDSMPRSLRWIGRHRIEVVPNGVDIERVDWALASRLREPVRGGQTFLVASVGRLIDVKNPSAVIKAVDAVGDSQWRIVFVGEGPMRPMLEAAVHEMRSGALATFTGLVPREEVYHQLWDADVCVSTSRVEGLPVAVLEAMACRRPVILSDIPAHREITRGVDFIPLVRPDDTDGFARALRRFRRMAPAARSDVGKRCRRLVEEGFGVRPMLARYDRIYSEIAEARARRRAQRGEPMSDWIDTHTLVRMALHRWWLIILLAGAAATGGFLIGHSADPVYRAETSLLVGEPLSKSDVGKDDLDVGERLANTYADLVRRQPVMQDVVRSLDLQMPWQTLANQVLVTLPENNPRLILISVDASSPPRAQAVAAAIARRLIELGPSGVKSGGFAPSLLDGLEQSIEDQETSIDQLTSELDTAPASEIKGLRAEIDHAQRLLLDLQATYADILASLSDEPTSNQIEILEKAEAGQSPVSPNVKLDILLGAILGFCIAIGLTYVLDTGDRERAGGRWSPTPEVMRENGSATQGNGRVPVSSGRVESRRRSR